MKNNNNSINIKGTINIKQFNKDKELKEEREIENLITNDGFALLSSIFLSSNPSSSTGVSHIAIGNGSGQTASSTALVNETHRADATESLVTTTVSNDTVKLFTEFTFTSDYSITEAGIFNDETEGTMTNYSDFEALNVVDGDIFEYTWKIQFQ